MKSDKDRIELAGLLDGEISDLSHVEQLGLELQRDEGLKLEFEEQREIKSLLTGLPEYEAPDFLATRVLGEIKVRQGKRSTSKWRNIALVAGSLAVCLIAVGLTVQLQQSLPAPRPVVISTLPDAAPASGHPGDIFGGATELGGSFDMALVESVDDESIKEFLEFANEIHRFKMQMKNMEDVSPDLPAAIMVLDEGGSH